MGIYKKTIKITGLITLMYGKKRSDVTEQGEADTL